MRARLWTPPILKFAGFLRSWGLWLAAGVALAARETATTAQNVLGTMIRNIAVAEATDNLLCQDTGIPIYNITVGRGVRFDDGDGTALKAAIQR